MNPIERQDEILELLYWFRGEHLAPRAELEQIERFVGMERADARAALDALVGRGLVVTSAGGYELTAAGIEEGRRRFQDDFGAYLGRESHLDCGDPDCQCQRGGEGPAACRP